MSSTRSFVASAVAVFSNRARSGIDDLCRARAAAARWSFASGSGLPTSRSTTSRIQSVPGANPRMVFQSWSSISSMFRAVSNSCSGRKTSSSAMSRKYIARKLAGSSSPRTFFLAVTSGAASSSSASSSSSSSDSLSSSAAAATRTSLATSSVSSVSISTPGVAPRTPSTSISSTEGSPAGRPIASADSGSVSLAGTGRVAGTLALASRAGRRPNVDAGLRPASDGRPLRASFTLIPRALIVLISIEPRRDPDTFGPVRDIRTWVEKYSGSDRSTPRRL